MTGCVARQVVLHVKLRCVALPAVLCVMMLHGVTGLRCVAHGVAVRQAVPHKRHRVPARPRDERVPRCVTSLPVRCCTIVPGVPPVTPL